MCFSCLQIAGSDARRQVATNNSGIMANHERMRHNNHTTHPRTHSFTTNQVCLNLCSGLGCGFQSRCVFAERANAMPPGNLKCTVGNLDFSRKAVATSRRTVVHTNPDSMFEHRGALVPQPCQYPGLAYLTKGFMTYPNGIFLKLH